ncbi:MAG: UvrD-helicase domain-containing protein [Bacteroidota bacterium]
MMQFSVYKSSAGSGKTFTLVKEYLKIVLQEPKSFRNILAITFTNKAANEMKQRVLSALQALAAVPFNPKHKAIEHLLPQLLAETDLDSDNIRSNAAEAVSLILHHYSDFAISTIDSFVHKLIRSFAYDLHLPVNFEVAIDTSEIIGNVVHLLIDNVGSNEELTRLMVDFVEYRLSIEKSWNPDIAISEFVKRMLDEDSQSFIQELKNLCISDFIRIRAKINPILKGIEDEAKAIVKPFFDKIEKLELPFESFFRGKTGIPKYFSYFDELRFDKLEPNTYVLTTINEDRFYKDRCTVDISSKIDSIIPLIRKTYDETRTFTETKLSEYLVLQNLQGNLLQMALINEIEKLFLDIKFQQNILPIAEFNRLISGVIVNEHVPYIYERIGEKYRHLMIDEFQDTSVLQWQNLLPLVDNSLAMGQFNMIVGDGKQAIYRFRGGEVEQFSHLPEIFQKPTSSFWNEREATLKRNFKEEELSDNHRSKAEIVGFNNSFFECVSQVLDPDFRKIYKNLSQSFNVENNGGMVQIEFYDKKKAEDAEEATTLYFEKIKSLIDLNIRDGFAFRDIAILCRGNDKASKIAQYLSNLEPPIPVVSFESLLLLSSVEVNFLINLLICFNDATDLIHATACVQFIHSRLEATENDFHSIIKNFKAGKEINPLFDYIDSLGIPLRKDSILLMPVYDICEELIRVFGLDKTPNAYLQFFLDAVLDYSKKNPNLISSFLEWWDKNRYKFSVVVPEGVNAVKIMTIHKSKGLEFPVVIFPFASGIIKNTNDTAWANFDNPLIPELKTLLLNLNVALEDTAYKEIYANEKSKSLLDTLNLLYVVMTRAESRLFIITETPAQEKKDDKMNSLPKIFKSYLVAKDFWNPEQTVYTFGKRFKRMIKEVDAENVSFVASASSSSDWREKLSVSTSFSRSWQNQTKELKKEKGLLIHNILSKVFIPDDLAKVLNMDEQQGGISAAERVELESYFSQLFSDEKISSFFSKENRIQNESSILLEGGNTLRPDRLVFENDKLIVIDYKTGKPNAKYAEQLNNYAQELGKMGYKSIQKYLLYLNTPPVLEEVV